MPNKPYARPGSRQFAWWWAQKRRRQRRDLPFLEQYSGAAAAYSLRDLAGDSPSVVRVRRSSDNTEQDFKANQINDGSLLSFVGAGDGLVTTWYDQSGNGNDAVQNEAPDYPRIVADGDLVEVDGKPAIEYSSNLEALYFDISGLSGKVGYLVGSGFRYQEVVVYDSAVSGAKTSIAEYYGFDSNEIDGGLSVALALNYTGAPVAGGYYAGLIDTIKGNIIAADAYQTGERYALIVSPQSLEGGRGTATGDLRWYTSNTVAANGADTRWNGLEATNAILALADTDFEAHGHIDSVRSSDPAPATPGGSDWYMPAMDELELLYRNFKPNNADNFTDDRSGTFPGNQVQGTNPSSDPNGIPYENGPRIPDVTYLDSFKENAAESLSQLRYWTTTWASTDRAWGQCFTLSGIEGEQFGGVKANTFDSVRPVRRVVLS